MNHRPLKCLAALLLASPVAFAQTPAAPSQIDPNTFIVGHPASPTWKVVRSNGQHPAVIVSRRAATPGVDSNRLIVQPPATVSWTVQPLLVAALPR